MPAYDFLSLDDKEFEKLVTSLLSAEEGVRYERFKPGKDAGIDGRYFSPSGTVILQCKHWARSGVKALIRALQNTEVEKVIKLKPTRYILATSLELSASDKAKIAALFQPYMISESDVMGNEDLNDLLERHPNIEISNNKLWMHSAAVLSQITSAAIRGRSQFSLTEMLRNRARYVETNAHFRAAEKLATNNVVLITGEPGIGKTTLAEQLCLDHVVRGYQLCVAAKDIEELEAIYNNDAKQVFYFDDFLGRTFLEAMSAHEDSHIAGFIKRVRSDKSKKFILTSRTTILNRGKALTDIFRLERIDRDELELSVTDLLEIDKARLLHSSIWFSGLSPEFIEVITLDKKYRRIISHRNFNPRLISFVTDPTRLSAITSDKYWNYLETMLDNPADIWEQVYDQQITEPQRLLLLLVVFGGRELSEVHLREAYQCVLSESNRGFSQGDNDYERNVRVLVGSLLNRSLSDDESVVYTLFNPSIADFAVPRVSTDKELLTSIFGALSRSSSIQYLDRLITLGKIRIPVAKVVLTNLTRRISTLPIGPQTVPLCMAITDLAIKHNPDGEGTSDIAMGVLNYLKPQADPLDRLPEVTRILKYGVKYDLIDLEFILPFTKNLSADDLELNDAAALHSLSSSMTEDEDRESLEEIFRPVSLKILRNLIEEEVRDREVLSNIYDVDETDEAVQLISETVENICKEIGLDVSESDVAWIADVVDIGDVINDNIERSMNSDDYTPSAGSTNLSHNEIDDLFLMDAPPPAE